MDRQNRKKTESNFTLKLNYGKEWKKLIGIERRPNGTSDCMFGIPEFINQMTYLMDTSFRCMKCVEWPKKGYRDWHRQSTSDRERERETKIHGILSGHMRSQWVNSTRVPWTLFWMERRVNYSIYCLTTEKSVEWRATSSKYQTIERRKVNL